KELAAQPRKAPGSYLEYPFVSICIMSGCSAMNASPARTSRVGFDVSSKQFFKKFAMTGRHRQHARGMRYPERRFALASLGWPNNFLSVHSTMRREGEASGRCATRRPATGADRPIRCGWQDRKGRE